ncbi:hypothetical protein BG004_005223 [Podila humilis]|nr:hypothetical protein BG004_005223 [Podila humilis]
MLVAGYNSAKTKITQAPKLCLNRFSTSSGSNAKLPYFHKQLVKNQDKQQLVEGIPNSLTPLSTPPPPPCSKIVSASIAQKNTKTAEGATISKRQAFRSLTPSNQLMHEIRILGLGSNSETWSFDKTGRAGNKTIRPWDKKLSPEEWKLQQREMRLPPKGVWFEQRTTKVIEKEQVKFPNMRFVAGATSMKSVPKENALLKLIRPDLFQELDDVSKLLEEAIGERTESKEKPTAAEVQSTSDSEKVQPRLAIGPEEINQLEARKRSKELDIKDSFLQEVAIVGRSNVGKSTMLNTLTESPNTARVSSKPGLTRQLNFYRCGDKFVVVDMPGYGFAFAKEHDKVAWKELIEEYLGSRKSLRRIYVMIDARHGLKVADKEFLSMLDSTSPTPEITKVAQDSSPVPAAANLATTSVPTASVTPSTPVNNTAETTPAPPPPKPASWAALVRSKNPAPPPSATPANGTSGKKTTELNKASQPNGVKFDGIADVLHNYKLSYASALIQPRGLVNNGNMCFMNAILQPLLHCPPFYNLLIQIGNNVVHSFKSTTPLVDSLIMFLREFQVVKKNQPEYGSPFVPEYVYDALRGLKRFDSMRGRQEDCQEFLGFLLDGLHEEFLAAMKDKPAGAGQNGSIDYDDSESGVSEDEWMEVTGPKNKASHTRSAQFSETPISLIFSGQLRSILRIPGQKDSITMEPYQSMQLDLTPDNVHTIEDALHNSTMPEVLDGFTNSEKGGMPVEATKKIFIEHVPPVLVLHLKRFIYRDGGTQKLHKQVGYKTVLNLQPEIISPARRPSSAIPYKLCGVVYHHGRTAAGGHYTCDVLRQNNEWLHIDDTNIRVIDEADVAVNAVDQPEQTQSTATNNGTLSNGHVTESAALAAALSASKSSDGVAYVLFYIRSDLKGSAPSSGASTPVPTPLSTMNATAGSGATKSTGKHSQAWSVSRK